MTHVGAGAPLLQPPLWEARPRADRAQIGHRSLHLFRFDDLGIVEPKINRIAVVVKMHFHGSWFGSRGSWVIDRGVT